MIYVGSEPSPFAALLRDFQESDGLAAITINLFAEQGAMSIQRSNLDHDLAHTRHDLAHTRSEKDALSAEVEGLRTTLGTAQSEKKTLSAEVEGLRTTLGTIWVSTSWKLTKPVRTVGKTLKTARHYLRTASRFLRLTTRSQNDEQIILLILPAPLSHFATTLRHSDDLARLYQYNVARVRALL